MTIHDLATPAILVDRARLVSNIAAMQSHCRQRGVALWPHIKTHKIAAILRMQLDAGAAGATCAKPGEAEAMLASGVRRIFIAYSLSHPGLAGRLRSLAEQLDELILAVTGEPQFIALEKLVGLAGLGRVPVLMAVDTGLHREGVRSAAAAARLAGRIRDSDRLDLRGLYTHEGHAYNFSPDGLDSLVASAHATLAGYSREMGGDLPFWPGCSVTATRMAGLPRVACVRPGAYVFGDLLLTEKTGAMPAGAVAASVWATVVDLPEPGLALIDAGSKVFGGDRTPEGIAARAMDAPALAVTRLSEEHGFVTGEGVDELEIGMRLRFIPAHVCPVVNLASRIHFVEGEQILESLPVDARGRSD